MILVWLCLLNFNKCVYHIFDNRFVSNWSLIAILELQKSCRLFLQLAIKYIIYTSADHLPWDTQLSHYDHIRCLLAQNRKGSLISRGCLIWRDTGACRCCWLFAHFVDHRVFKFNIIILYWVNFSNPFDALCWNILVSERRMCDCK